MTLQLESIKRGPTGAVARTYRHSQRGSVDTLTIGNLVILRTLHSAHGWRIRVQHALGLKSAGPAKSLNKRMRALR